MKRVIAIKLEVFVSVGFWWCQWLYYFLAVPFLYFLRLLLFLLLLLVIYHQIKPDRADPMSNVLQAWRTLCVFVLNHYFTLKYTNKCLDVWSSGQSVVRSKFKDRNFDYWSRHWTEFFRKFKKNFSLHVAQADSAVNDLLFDILDFSSEGILWSRSFLRYGNMISDPRTRDSI